MANADFSAARLRELLQYDPQTGALTLKVDVSHIRKAGQRVDVAKHGKRSVGYKVVNIFGRRILAHRVAWAIHTGQWPDSDIDHVNGDRFRAQITVNGRTVHIGMFDTPEDAHAAYLLKKAELHAIGC